VIASIAERLTARTWTPSDIEAMIGAHQYTAVAYADAEDVRVEAASGGAVTALLLDLLASGKADGALVCVTHVESGTVRARYHVATTPAEVLAARGSTYVLGDFVREAIPLIEGFEGRVAVVGLPCEITAVERRSHLNEKVACRISLFCGHATRPELVDALTERLVAEAGSELVSFTFRTGAWRGQLRAVFADGTTVERPSSAYLLYQNLSYFVARKCLACGDHFGYDADVCAGDLWSYRYKSEPIKHTALIAKTPRGAELVRSATGGGAIISREVPVTDILDGQRRIAPFHHNVTARHQAGSRRGVSVPDRGQRVLWHERAAARMVIRAFLSSGEIDDARRLLGQPRWRLKLKLYVQKGLESLS
jgi:coenzyme F420 hydrogenase subunit beta